MVKSFSLSDLNYLYNLAVNINVYSLLPKYISSLGLFRNLQKNNFEYQSLSEDNINITSENQKKYFEGTDVDLGPCEQKLRKYYNIPDDVKLTIIKLDYKKNDSTVSNIQYEVFNPKNRSQSLDLSICDEEKVIIKNPIDSSISLKRISLIMDSTDNPKNIFSEKNDFYNNYCSIFTSENETDVLIQDRKKYYNYKDKICQKGCEIQNINIKTGEVFCSCKPNKGFVNISIDNIDDILNDNNNILMDDSYNNYITDSDQEYSSSNSKVFKCIKNIGNDFFENYIIIIFTLLLIGYISIFIYFLLIQNKKLEKQVDPIENEEIKEKPKPHKKKITIFKEGFKSENNNLAYNDDGAYSKVPIKKPIRDDKRKNNVSNSDFDKDLIIFKNAKDDKRTFIELLISSLSKRVIIIFSLNFDKFTYVLKLILLLFTLINYIAINAFFFNEKNIHQIFIDKGKYNFAYQIKYIILASLISSLFLSLAKCFCLLNQLFMSIKDISNFSMKRLIFLGSLIGLFTFYWIYLASLTSTYINSKMHLLINSIFTFLFCCILDCLLALTSIIFRIIGIKKENIILYNISRIINYI